MSRTLYLAFYPSLPFWVGEEPDDADAESVSGKMAEHVYVQKDYLHELIICRDGRIALRIRELEGYEPAVNSEQFDAALQRGVTHLNYLNSFYLILDSAVQEIDRLSYFNFREITSRDTFALEYVDGKLLYEPFASQSVTSEFQRTRYSSNRLASQVRQSISIDAIAYAGLVFSNLLNSNKSVLEKDFSELGRSLSEYKNGNYEISLVVAWLLIERSINEVWKSHLDRLNAEVSGGSKRINAERMEFLTGNSFVAAVTSHVLELFGLVDCQLLKNIDRLRKLRNKIVHKGGSRLSAGDIQLAIETAHELIARRSEIRLMLNFGQSLSGN
ncbi:hypothetical protein [Uliginosibacterium sp. TH139]|uniref:hypothetical protein n=1 Tax=Uliginosibacterium sp. TH139 TaxID=2067453 RepID=UPI000C7B7163|nr:hypothetical protein [Uliginosibacterium sp. TH139]PLK50555.1 hypothetical protein C0V76_01655 [Uliginosibacterium sp. TH139]